MIFSSLYVSTKKQKKLLMSSTYFLDKNKTERVFVVTHSGGFQAAGTRSERK